MLIDAQARTGNKCPNSERSEYISPGVTDEFINHMKSQDRYYISDIASSYYPHIFPRLKKPESPFNTSLVITTGN